MAILQVGTSKNFGLLIREARKSRQLSQQKLADLAGVGRRFVSELEAGKPSLEFEKVLTVSSALGLVLFAAPASELKIPAPAQLQTK
jgi:y4mF family transcriptional regulator